MDRSPLEKKLNEDIESRKIHAQEELILDAAEKILDLMQQKNKKKIEVASILGRSPAYVTQLLNGSRNMTLRTISDIAFALDSRIHIDFCDSNERDGWIVAAAQPLKIGRVNPVNAVASANENELKTIEFQKRYAVAPR